jgi:hypothetical protein
MAANVIRLSEAEAFDFHNYIPNDALERHCPLTKHREPTFYDLASASALGEFAVLPAELQLNVIEILDVKSLMAFRRVSKEASNLVDGMSAWKKVRCALISLSFSGP